MSLGWIGILMLAICLILGAGAAELKVYCASPADGVGPPGIFMIYSTAPNLASVDRLCRSSGMPSEAMAQILNECGWTQCTIDMPPLYFVSVATLSLETSASVGLTPMTLTEPGNSNQPTNLSQCLEANPEDHWTCLPTLTQDSLECLGSNLDEAPLPNQICITNWSYIIGGLVVLLVLSLGTTLYLIIIYCQKNPEQCCALDPNYILSNLIENVDEDFS